MRVEDFLRLFEASGVSLKEVYDKDDLSQYDSYMAVDGEIVGFGIRNFDLSGIIRDILEIRSLRYLLIANTNISAVDFADTNLTNLQSLDVSENELLHLPKELSSLTNLQSLDVSWSQLLQLPKELSNLTNLQSLDVSYNELSELPKELFNLTNLQSLNVSGSNLSELPKELFNLTNLQSLDVSDNELSELPKELFNLTNLQSLGVSGIGLSELPKELFNLTNLQSLDVSYNQLSQLPKELFNLTNLHSLNVSGGELSELPKELFNLTNLRSLDATENQLSELPKELFNLTNLRSLDVSGGNLSELPKELFNLTSLQSLNVSYNELSELPKELFNLTSLQSLNVSYNELSQLPKELFNLINLRSLNVSRSNLSELPKELFNLTNLRSLNVSYNELSELPKELFNLTNLRSLNVSQSNLSELPKELFNLTNLRSLDVGWNNLSHLPLELFNLTNLQSLNVSGGELSELPKELGYLKRLVKLVCRSSNIKTFPNEIVSLKALRHIYIDEESFNPEYVEALKSGVKNLQNFISQKIKYNIEKLYEAKMLIVGEPGAGKTSLMNKILDREYTLPTSKEDISTIGVDIKSKEFYCDEADTIKFRVNMWDFGGQQIQYLAHQFFLTESSLYVLVSDDRKQHTVFDYWFYIINLLSDNSPILVVLNEINHKSISNFKLSSFSGIFTTHDMEQLSVDLSVMDDGRYDAMVKKIESMLKALPHIGRELPKKWVEIRRDIAKQYNGSYYMNLSDFKNICEKHGLLDEEREVLSRHFHNLGIFLHYTDDIGGLENYIFLNPEWLMDGVYSVLSDKSVSESKGRFSKDWFFGFLKNHKNGYSDEMQKAILQLMLKDKFELCYRIKDRGEYISPQLLPNYDKEDLHWDSSDNIYYLFKYEFMPRGILSRLIVRLSDLLDGDLAWREMVVLKKGGARAKIEEKISDKSINISIMGDRFLGVGLLYDIKRELEGLHAKSFKNVKYKEFLPCVCRECLKSNREYFRLDTIRSFLDKKKETIECRNSAEDVSIHGLISNVGIFEARYKDKKGFDGMPDIHINIKDSFVQKQNVSATANVAVSVNSQINNAISDLASLKKELAKLQDGLDEGMATKAEEIFVALKKLRDENKDKEITEDDIAESGIVGEVEEFLDGVGKVVSKTDGIVDGGNKIIERATKFYESVKNIVGNIDLKAFGDIFGA